MSGDFSADQKRYLEGFMSGVAVLRQSQSDPAPMGPDAVHFRAQDEVTKAGGKLADQEKWKRQEHPFDAYARLKDEARQDKFPKPADNFRWRYHGLFYVAPAQDSYMCRLRIPNGVLKHWQFAGVADVAETFGGGYAHVTTRANLQIRDIGAKDAANVVEAIVDIGLTSRGSGADNIRNVTGDATAGIGVHELLDTRPYARDWHHHILNDLALYGLPRKFNVAFDGGGAIPTLEDTNDIGFQAVEVRDGGGIEPGVWFRLMLGGITGHKDIARDTGVVLRPHEAVQAADAIVRVFIAHGDRTNRNRARLKYLLDAWGFETFLGAVEEKLGRKLVRVDSTFVAPRPIHDRRSHIGVHAQKQAGMFYIGVALPVGKITAAQMRAVANIARDCGDGDIRLSVWQNLLISGVPTERVAEATARIVAAGLRHEASAVRSGMVACTGSSGCRFAGADTKADAQRISDWCDERIKLDQPINIHLTGCHNSCAQHYIGDIGLIGARVSVNDDGDTVDGYHFVVGGGFGAHARIGEELWRDVKATDAPGHVEALLRAYLAHRVSVDQSFNAFATSCAIDDLRRLAEEQLP